ncbi:MAG: DNA-directed RNA polymerase subunit alpha [Armatimonadetes bacterium]|nr:DNA-directed RNA polymerase subunit alpha [Armatimonadota bacterium]
MTEIVEPRIDYLGENTFVIEPLERGFGTTLGNSLRRVLLSSLPGAAVTHVKIDGVLHEFSTLPGVAEDTTEIILNIKKLNLKLHADRRKVLRLEAQGEGPVTAADILPDPEVEILNPDLVLAELTDRSAKLIMDIYIERGIGYVPAEKQMSQEQVIGLIPVDSLFSPIRQVHYVVEDTRVRQKTDYDRLILEVTTDGSILPYEAVSTAARVLQNRLDLFSNLQRPEVVEPVFEEKKEASILDMPVENLGLSVRSLNCLKRAGVRTVGDLQQYTEEDVMKLKNFGQKSLDEIKDKLVEFGLGLRTSLPTE